jgi:Uma2 family endonuclease
MNNEETSSWKGYKTVRRSDKTTVWHDGTCMIRAESAIVRGNYNAELRERGRKSFSQRPRRRHGDLRCGVVTDRCSYAQGRAGGSLPSAWKTAYTPAMHSAASIGRISVEDYLAGEWRSEVRHEYLGGAVYAMAGASREHNRIAGNLFNALDDHFGDGPCEVFMVDVKVRLHIAREDVFYYPDVMVTCDPRDTDRYFLRYPKVLIEVLSNDTERTDRREKFLSYTQLDSLEEYVLVAQHQCEVTVFRRSAQWNPEVLTQGEHKLELPSLRFTMALSAIYRRVLAL